MAKYEMVVCGTDPRGRMHTLTFRSDLPSFRPPAWLTIVSVCPRAPTSRCDRSGALPASVSPPSPCRCV